MINFLHFIMKFLYIIFICLATTTISLTRKNSDPYFRLPNNVVPTKYILEVNSILSESIFIQKSTVVIHVHVIKSSNKITLHSRNLHIAKVKLTTVDEYPTQIKIKYELEPEYDFLHVQLSKEESLSRNTTYKLEIDYAGKIERGMTGYYRSCYKDYKGNIKWISTTHFEPISARAAFPCFDEPALKARFTIKLGHQDRFTAISNMPLKSTQKIQSLEGWVIDIFEETPPMSTYLVAFSINDFGFKTTNKSNKYGDTIINIWARRESLDQVKFAKNSAPKILSFFEEYFDIAYPLPKSDILAVPDFSSEAIENWGLVTIRESGLLYEPGVSREVDKFGIVFNVARELAHYWFGDLVTMRWWTYLWLKESFAMYLSQVAVEQLFPSFTSEVINNILHVYLDDSLETARPVSMPIDDQYEIYENYDTISYYKASYLIRMMETFLGKKVFQAGLIHYLKKYKYDSAIADDLWHSLSIVARETNSIPENIDMKTIMDTWTIQPGYPLVTVVRDYTSGTVTISQQRFLENVKKKSDSCYWVPLSFTTSEENDFRSTKPKLWLPCPKENVHYKLNKSDSKSWILFNIGALSLYRVNYDETNWKMLIHQLDSDYKKINSLNRIILIDNVMELAIANQVDFKIAFKLIKYIRHDDHLGTWSIVLEKLEKIGNILNCMPHFGLWATYLNRLLNPVYDDFMGIEKKTFTKFELLIIYRLCAVKNSNCEHDAAIKFLNWRLSRGKHKIPVEIRPSVYCAGLRRGDEHDWDFLWQQYLHSNSATERSDILATLGCTEHWWLLVRYLTWMIKENSDIRNQDAVTVFQSVISNSQGSYVARLFFYEHIKEIYNIQSPKGVSMRPFLILVGNSLRTKREYHEFKEFIKQNHQYFQMAHLTIKQIFEYMEIRKNWAEYVYPKVVDALKEEDKLHENLKTK